MQKTATLFILGAGSSAEFKLPTGPDLLLEIAKTVGFEHDDFRLTAGDQEIWRQLRRNKADGLNSFLKAGGVIAKGLPLARSIDDFLYNHGDNAEVVRLGKIGIASAILKAERESRLSPLLVNHYRDTKFTSLKDTWLYKLFTILHTDIKIGELTKLFEGIAFINFNYDRCLELFLYNAIQRAYSVPSAEAAAIVSRLRVERPYGRIGALPWEERSGTKVEFGAASEQTDLLALSEALSTYTEQTYAPSELERIKELILSAQRIVILGFGFHKQNMRLLSVDRPAQQLPVYATVHGASDADVGVFRNLVSKSLRGGAGAVDIFSPAKCADFIDHYGLQLAFERTSDLAS